LVIDDYAHHPTEIEATLVALKQHHKRPIVAVFQPHRFSRVKHLEQRFAESFGACDKLIVTEVYAAGESAIEGVSGQRMASLIEATGHPCVEFLADLDRVAGRLAELAVPGDVVITMGAGSVTQIGPELLALLRQGV
jgi:UDP-N-acetylmuramate--alanine ligase